jgi:hypothetical protein
LQKGSSRKDIKWIISWFWNSNAGKRRFSCLKVTTLLPNTTQKDMCPWKMSRGHETLSMTFTYQITISHTAIPQKNWKNNNKPQCYEHVWSLSKGRINIKDIIMHFFHPSSCLFNHKPLYSPIKLCRLNVVSQFVSFVMFILVKFVLMLHFDGAEKCMVLASSKSLDLIRLRNWSWCCFRCCCCLWCKCINDGLLDSIKWHSCVALRLLLSFGKQKLYAT